MSTNSPIEWTDHTFNPWWGCTKISPGCTNCYAESMANRFGGDVWGPLRERRIFGEAHWAEPLKWNRKAAATGQRLRVFCASMADVFDESAPAGEREKLWGLIEATPFLNWQVLTKRPESIEGLIPARWRQRPRENVWFGTSVESQDYTWRVEELARVPSATRFLSVEPLLGPVSDLPLSNIDWVIVGGESGPRARHMDPKWVLEIKSQCEHAGVPFFFKQWGGRNKKAAGRELEGRHFDAMPRDRTSAAVG